MGSRKLVSLEDFCPISGAEGKPVLAGQIMFETMGWNVSESG